MIPSIKPLRERTPLPPERRRTLDAEGGASLQDKGDAFPSAFLDLQALSDALERDSRRFERLLREEGSLWKP